MSKREKLVLSSVLKYFSDNGFSKSKASLQSESKLSGKKHPAIDLVELFSQRNGSKKLKSDLNNESESESGSSGSSDSSESESSSSDSSSDSSDSSSDSSDSNDSSSDSSDSSSDSSDSSDSSSDSSDSSSDSSDSESDDESVDIVQKRMEDMKKKAEEAKKAADEWAKNASPNLKKESAAKGPRKSGEAFRRVDTEVWNQQIVDGLENNSYESTFGLDGYGLKAHKVLSTVRGKDFRHEKTKRKRSTYRGGNISLESKSFKY